MKDVYDQQEYEKSQQYKRENTRFSFYSSTFSFLVLLAAIILGVFGWLNGWLTARVENYYLVVLLFFGVLALVSDVLSIPFQAYDTFVIEERYGFNRTTLRTFILDRLKGWLLMVSIGGGILLLITWFYRVTGTSFWWLAWIVITLFSLFMNMFYSELIVPLFNKQVPLEPGALRDAIELMAQKTGYSLSNIYVIDGSRRSSKSNAYFTGLGHKKRIVLYDTLIRDLEPGEITAVLAHEIGHYKRKHTLANLLTGILQTGIMLYLFSLFVSVPEFSKALGADEASFQLGLISFAILYSPVSLFTGILTHMLSRKFEYETDRYAADYAEGEDLISALKKLTRKNLRNLTPHPTVVFFQYSHPTLLQRIRALREAS